MERTLTMSFLNEEGRISKLRLGNIRDNITETEVKNVMNTIIEKNIFSDKGMEFKAANSAEIVSKESEELFVK